MFGNKNTKAGFTVLEMMVVIALISILSLLIFNALVPYSKINRKELMVSQETVRMHQVVEEVESFLRRSTQDIEITYTDDIVNNKETWVVQDKLNIEHKLTIIKTEYTLNLNGNDRSNNILRFELNRDDEDDDMLEIIVENVNEKVVKVEHYMYLRIAN